MKSMLFSIIEENTLPAMLETFNKCIELPIQVIDEWGTTLYSCGEKCSYCLHMRKFFPKEDSCEKIHVTASKRAISYGGSYLFSCHAELYHMVLPLLSKDMFLGSVLVGPFLMDEPDSMLISVVAQRYHVPMESAFELYDEIYSVPVISPDKANHISNLVYYLFSGLISEAKEELKKNNQKLLQQSMINESIQHYKILNVPENNYPYEIEQELIGKIKTGNIESVQETLNKLLGYVLLSEGNNVNTIKNRAVELCSVLSRTAIESGNPADRILKLNNEFLNNISNMQSTEELCLQLQNIAEEFYSSIIQTTTSGNSQVIKKSIQYIADHFDEPLTLGDLCGYVHLNSSYYSRLFKQSMGISFREYLNSVRVEEAKRLLANTDYSIIDIAVATGFENQSYFTKVFKKTTGLTPKQYRNGY